MNFAARWHCADRIATGLFNNAMLCVVLLRRAAAAVIAAARLAWQLWNGRISKEEAAVVAMAIVLVLNRGPDTLEDLRPRLADIANPIMV